MFHHPKRDRLMAEREIDAVVDQEFTDEPTPVKGGGFDLLMEWEGTYLTEDWSTYVEGEGEDLW